MQAELLRPCWDAPANVSAAMTLRGGDHWAPPFDRLSLGGHGADEAQAVARNREVLRAAARAVLLRQVHGSKVVNLSADSRDGVEADACVTSTKHLACLIQVADCLPVLFTNRQGTAVAAAHAGWRGLSGSAGSGVLESSYAGFRSAVLNAGKHEQRTAPDDDPDQVAADTLAWLGPCIGQDAFEVGAEVHQAFVEHHAQAAAKFRAGRQAGKYYADLQGLARQRLAAMGIRSIYGNDGTAAWCTYSNSSRFFSYRRDRLAPGGNGRMAAAIWLT